MKQRFQFSIKALLLMLTGISVWLALVCNHARRQAVAVARIEALGGIVYFEHQDLTHGRRTQTIAGQVIPAPCYDRFREPPVSPWLRKRLGDDFFREAAVVDLSKIDVSDAEFDRLRALLPWAKFRLPASYARSHLKPK